MLGLPYVEILQQEGFEFLGELNYRLHLTVWWHPAPDTRLQVIVLNVGDVALIKGDKSYYVKSVSSEGETWARDIGLLHDYLEGHFPELRIAFSHFRDVPPELAKAEVRRRTAVEAPTLPLPTVQEVARMQEVLDADRRKLRAEEGVLQLLGRQPDLLTAYLRRRARSHRAEVEQLNGQLNRKRERLGLLEHLQREYRRKGSAAIYTFGISSNLQIAENASEFRDALREVVKELRDTHRYQVLQKLGGGRLNIHVDEANDPVIAWIEQWFGGAMTPAQTRRMRHGFEAVRVAAEAHVMVTPDDPIEVDSRTRHAAKHVAAHFVSDMLRRLDKPDAAGHERALSPEGASPETLPLALGWHVDDAGKLTGPALFPLTQMVHLYISGTTGGGKSFLARVLVEEAARHEALSVLVLDPRNQSVGLLVPEDRPNILEQYEQFHMKPGDARGFPFAYFAPGLPYAPPPPADLAKLAHGRAVVSLKGLDDGKRCSAAAEILDAVFDHCSGEESERPRLLIVVDEAQLFTRRRLNDTAKEAAARAERALDRIAREGRKFGIVLTLISQTMKDFSYDLASIRQMTTTKIFLRNSDREIEYASDVIGDGRLLVQLPTATALAHNANWGVARIRVRPPYSKVFELGEADIRRLIRTNGKTVVPVTADAQRLLDVAREHGSPPNSSLNMSRAAELAGITSKRRLLELIAELEQAGAIRTKKLRERGRPRVIEVLTDSALPEARFARDKKERHVVAP